MPEKKRQHYVPKFLLKSFSIDEQDKQINIYNITQEAIISSASLKEQAAENYFYGKDGLIENSFEKVETESAKIFKDIISGKLPLFNTPEHSAIIFFTLSLGARTLYKAEQQVEIINKLMKSIGSMDPELKDHVNKFEIKIDNPTALSLKAVATSLPLATDLKYKLLLNKTEIPFLISDNPVVYYNNFLENKKKIGSNIGTAVKGLQIFLPISPFHQMIFYDSEVYKIGSGKRIIIEIQKDDDIMSLNGLQYLNANINLFFNNEFHSSNIEILNNMFGKHRRSIKANLAEYTEVNSQKEIPNVLLQFYAEDIKCGLNLSFIKILKKAKDYELGNKLVHLRNEKLFKLQREFSDLVNQQKYKAADFNDFLIDKINGIK